jgi:hypothetical protein
MGEVPLGGWRMGDSMEENGMKEGGESSRDPFLDFKAQVEGWAISTYAPNVATVMVTQSAPNRANVTVLKAGITAGDSSSRDFDCTAATDAQAWIADVLRG